LREGCDIALFGGLELCGSLLGSHVDALLDASLVLAGEVARASLSGMSG